MGYVSESSILRVIEADDCTTLKDLNHIYLYRIFRNEFDIADGYTPGEVRLSKLIYSGTAKPVRFVGKGNGVRLVDFTRINPNEGEMDISTGGRLTIWYAKPNTSKAMATFREYYVEKRDALLAKAEKYDVLIDKLGFVGV